MGQLATRSLAGPVSSWPRSAWSGLGIEALPAVDRLDARRLERHFGRLPASGADDGVHLPRPRAARLAGGPAVGAAGGIILKAFTGVELLLPRREAELRAAVAAGQNAIGEPHREPHSFAARYPNGCQSDNSRHRRRQNA